jgi:plasmid maintenance system antidote protein VapI
MPNGPWTWRSGRAIGEPVMGVAKKLGVTRQHLHRILAEKAPVTPDMAVRLEMTAQIGFGRIKP